MSDLQHEDYFSLHELFYQLSDDNLTIQKKQEINFQADLDYL